MVVVKWCKCLNVKICLVNPPTPVENLKWVTEHTSMRKCGESKVQGNVVTMELDKMVQARMVQGWQVWKCFNCGIDVCAIDLNNSLALVNMDMEDNDDITQMHLDSHHAYSDCFRVIVDTSPSSSEDAPQIAERDPNSIENFNMLQGFVDEYLADAERVMEKRIRQYIKEQNEIFSQLRSKVNSERTIIWRKMCNIVSNPTPPQASQVLSSTPSASAGSVPASTNPAAPTSRSRASSVSRPHSRSVSGAVAPFAGGFPGAGSVTGSGSSVTPAVTPALGSTFGTVSGFHVQGSTPTTTTTTNNKPELPTEVDTFVPTQEAIQPTPVEQAPTTTTPVQPEQAQPITPPKPTTKPENVTKWQAAPRPGSTEIKQKSKPQRSESPTIFSFDDDDEQEDLLGPEEFEDEPDDEPTTPTINVPQQPQQPKVLDSSHLLGSSLPVAIPARNMNPAAHQTTTRHQQQTTTTKKTSSNLNLAQPSSSSSPNPNANAPVGSMRAPTTVSMSSVSMAANVSSTAPTHQYHALRPQAQNVAPLSSSASEQLMVPKQPLRENYLGEAAEESLPVELASSFIVPLSLSRRLKSLI